jgi:hypothetical protein
MRGPRRNEGHLSLDDEANTVVLTRVLSRDPTDDWIYAMNVRAGLDAVRNSGLLILKAAGFQSQELGVNSVIDMRASRARKAFATWLSQNG